MKKRVGIIALLHESNTFIQAPTTLEHFHSNLIATGEKVLSAFRGSQHEVGGFIEAVESAEDVELVGIFGARAMPYGTISTKCWNELWEMLEVELKKSLPLDGILVAPHGATVAESALDADGDWLARLRKIVGPDMPLIGTLDLHANVSVQMISATDALFGYRTNPHLDQKARGLDAGKLMLSTLRSGVLPKQHLVQLPFCVNIERQATSEPQGEKLWNYVAEVTAALENCLGISCFYGFPYADVEEMGATVLAVGMNAEVAESAAVQVAKFWWEHRQEFNGELVSIRDAVSRAVARRMENKNQPVGLLEMGDNVGGGSPGDGTSIVHGWLEAGTGPILTVIADPAVVQATSAYSIGTELELEVGGKDSPDLHGPPIVDNFRIVSRSSGKFRESGVTHGGYTEFDQGDTVVLVGRKGVTVIVTSKRVGPMSLQQVLSQKIRLEDFSAVVIKGVHAPVAAYSGVCSELIRVNTSGVTTADLAQLRFERRRVPMFPFERDTNWPSSER